MPTYQYACTACSERLEVVQRFTDAPLTECPACGGTLRKVFSPVGVVFKGSGFYKTDSRSSSSSSSSSSADGKPGGDAKPSSSDAKPASSSSDGGGSSSGTGGAAAAAS